MILCEMTLEKTDAYFFNGVSFFIKKSGKVSTLNLTFLVNHFFVQSGRLLHVPIDIIVETQKDFPGHKSVFVDLISKSLIVTIIKFSKI